MIFYIFIFVRIMKGVAWLRGQEINKYLIEVVAIH